MKQKIKHPFWHAGALFVLFILFTLCVAAFDVKPIGPEGSEVGFSRINGFVFQLLGVNPLWYEITDLLGVVAILFACCFAGMGLCQLIRARSIRKVDRRILALGGFYGLVMVFYLIFEIVVINYRPILLDGQLEASYPSSHTMLVLCVVGSAAMMTRALWPEKKRMHWCSDGVTAVLCTVTVFGRLLSGVHWLSDIVGAVLLSAALLGLFRATLFRLDETGL